MEKSDLPIALRVAYLSLHRQSDAAFSKHGVTADQFVLLATLARGTALTQRELASRMTSDPSTVRAMIVLLEKQGLVRRELHPSDSRARTVELTAAGSRKFKQLWKAGDAIRDKIYAALGANEAKTLISLLERVTQSLAAQQLVKN